jgi:hypothetical protein
MKYEFFLVKIILLAVSFQFLAQNPSALDDEIFLSQDAELIKKNSEVAFMNVPDEVRHSGNKTFTNLLVKNLLTTRKLRVCGDANILGTLTVNGKMFNPNRPLTHPYAMISDNTSQFVESITSEALVTLNTNVLLNQITHSTLVNPSRVIIQVPGIYVITFRAQINGGSADINLWVKKNGIDVAGSSSKSSLQNANDYRLVTVTLITSAVAHDYYEIVQASTNINVGLAALPPELDPIRPDSSSIVFTIYKISD